MLQATISDTSTPLHVVGNTTIYGTDKLTVKPIYEGPVSELSEEELEISYIGTVEVVQAGIRKIYAGDVTVMTEVYQAAVNDDSVTDINVR